MDSIEKRIRSALLPIIPIVAANQYTGDALTYVVFNYDETGAGFAESTAYAVLCLVQVHLFLPLNDNPRSLKNAIRAALGALGTFPSITNASDGSSQHYVFEFEALSYG